MTKEQASENGKISVVAKCSGGCGEPIRYQAEQTSDEAAWPGLFPVGYRIGFAGGHLCQGCESVVLAALSARRVQLGQS
jgi:hypothetical protein